MGRIDWYVDPSMLHPGDVIQVNREDTVGHRVIQVDPRAEDLGGGWMLVLVPIRSKRRRHLIAKPGQGIWRNHGIHWQACGECGELWPCRARTDEREVADFRRQLDRLCAHCGEEVKAGQWSVGQGGRIWHNRKANGCRAAAEEVLGRGLADADASARGGVYVASPQWDVS